MATSAPNGGQPAGGMTANGQEGQARVLAQYIKDLSFENPNAGRVPVEPNEQPNLKIGVNVNAKAIAPGIFESVLEMTAHCAVKAGVLYELEVYYATVLQVDSVSEQQLEPFLLINCPTLCFPFVRRLVADITREGGFPPLLLDPMDFGGLYMQRKQQAPTTVS